MLGGCLLAQGKYATAEPPRIASFDGMKQCDARAKNARARPDLKPLPDNQPFVIHLAVGRQIPVSMNRRWFSSHRFQLFDGLQPTGLS